MTGFAAVSGSVAGFDWEWTLRAVNGKGLDLRFRLPPGFERLEVAARNLAGKRLSRGSVNVSLSVRREGADAQQLTLNRSALDAVIAVAEEVARTTGAKPASVDGILAVRGVMDLTDATLNPEQEAERDAALEAGFAQALDALDTARASEGEKLAIILGGQLDTVATLTGEAEALPCRTPEAIAARLREAVEQLVEAAPALDPERLHQEAVLAAAKADIREELDRLAAHVEAARTMLANGGAVGRDLNFLAQEFNREANTLCSKSNDVALTRIGLQLKSVIDQFREQVQNVE